MKKHHVKAKKTTRGHSEGVRPVVKEMPLQNPDQQETQQLPESVQDSQPPPEWNGSWFPPSIPSKTSRGSATVLKSKSHSTDGLAGEGQEGPEEEARTDDEIVEPSPVPPTVVSDSEDEPAETEQEKQVKEEVRQETKHVKDDEVAEQEKGNKDTKKDAYSPIPPLKDPVSKYRDDSRFDEKTDKTPAGPPRDDSRFDEKTDKTPAGPPEGSNSPGGNVVESDDDAKQAESKGEPKNRSQVSKGVFQDSFFWVIWCVRLFVWLPSRLLTRSI